MVTARFRVLLSLEPKHLEILNDALRTMREAGIFFNRTALLRLAIEQLDVAAAIKAIRSAHSASLEPDERQ